MRGFQKKLIINANISKNVFFPVFFGVEISDFRKINEITT